jgi:hypothetical protein
MRSTQDRDNVGRPGSGGPDQYGPGFAAGGRRPWFGPKRVGFGYRPQTWQGWAIMALLAALAVTAGALAPNTPWFWAAVALVILTPFAIIAVQRTGR